MERTRRHQIILPALSVLTMKRKVSGSMGWIFIKRRVTGEKAEMEQDDNRQRMFSTRAAVYVCINTHEASDHIALPDMVAPWTLDLEFPTMDGRSLIRLYYCPMRHRVRMYGRNPCKESNKGWMQMEKLWLPR